MKKSLFIGFVVLAGANLVEAKDLYVSSYIRYADISKINAIKTDEASCGCQDGCSLGKNQIQQQEFINLQNATTQKAAKALITVIAKS
ncbi:MAG: hypothetical protein Q8Q60_04065 [Candidatus Chromulinivorax sp.]|nr:hypothetical protein [Candidatus Chromulinivorax sp.]